MKTSLKDPEKKAEVNRLVEEILRSGSAISNFIETRSPSAAVKQGWAILCGQLSTVARSYNVHWPDKKEAPAPAAAAAPVAQPGQAAIFLRP